MPQLVDQPVARDSLASVQQQDREQLPLLPTTKRNLRLAVVNLERTQNQVAHPSQ